MARNTGLGSALKPGYLVKKRWRLVRKLGQDSFGQVWLAEDLEMFGVERAIKFVLHPAVADSVRREAKRLVQLERGGVDWRHLARLLHILPGAVPTLIYEYIEGQDLYSHAERYDRGWLPIHDAVAITSQILAALAELHHAGIVHRDLHPANIKIVRAAPNYLVKVLDLGLAWPGLQLGPQTGGSALLVEPIHPFAERMEQRMGEAPDARTDLFSVGVLLWWMLTGKRGLPVGMSLAESWSEGPAALRSIVERACIVPRQKRFHSAGEMVEALANVGQEWPGVGSPTTEMDHLGDEEDENLEFRCPECGGDMRVCSCLWGYFQSLFEDDRVLPKQMLSVRPDGSGDYGTLEEALAQAPAGGVVELSAGEYRLARPVTVTRPITLIGAGTNHTSVVCTAAGHVVFFKGEGPFVLEGIAFRHDGKEAANVVEVEGGQVRFAQCAFSGAVYDFITGYGGDGLWLHGQTVGPIRQCMLYANEIGISIGEQAQPLLEANTCTENESWGISYAASATGAALGNTCTENASAGIHVSEQAKPVLETNACERNRGWGIIYTDNAEGTARKNVCNYNESAGILVTRSSRPLLEDNTCERNRAWGIHYLKGATGTANSNKCSKNSRAGICVGGWAEPLLEANNCERNQNSGIVYLSDAAGTAYGNRCSENGHNGIYVNGQALPTLVANTCTRNKSSGIKYAGDAAGTARKNICTQNEGAGLEVTDQARPILEANTCEANMAGGIDVCEQARSVLKNNTCINNNIAGVVVEEDTDPC